MPEPLTDAAAGPMREIAAVVWQVLADNLPRDLTWPFLLLTAAIATAIWLLRRGHGSKDADGRERAAGLVEFLLPRKIYTHLSARVDIWLYVLDRALTPLWMAAFIVAIAPAVEQSVGNVLGSAFGGSPSLASSYAWMLLYSLFTLLCYDFVFFLIHYIEHKVPALWVIHKVHHSAEVLTPLTRYREHFLEGPIYAAGAALSYGFAAGVFSWLFKDSITAATLFNIGFFSLLFGFNGSFRHYHVAFHYPRWLSKWLHSPVMHHVHHSYLEPHWDKNFAVFTSLWDRMFGTLYIPARDEYTPWGLGPATQHEYRTFWQNTTGPFRDWYAMLRKGQSPQSGSVPDGS
jgi:sterol desaturase/sphingolipid hydroxylase (fatty acid hydroxylase superfamily)